MATLADLQRTLDGIAPPEMAFSWDRIGRQLGDPRLEVSRVLVTLDPSLASLLAAVERGCEAIVSHHPLIWEPLRQIQPGSPVEAMVRADVGLIVAHTNWDCASGGVNDTLAERLELEDVRAFGRSAGAREWKLATFVPAGDEGPILDALARAGAGRIGLYERCAFIQSGRGTFRPLPGASPTIGDVGGVEEVEELRVEMVVPESRLRQVQEALLAAHPYETPAFDWIALRDPVGQPMGRIGSLPNALGLRDFIKFVSSRLDATCVAWGSERAVRRVAVVGGAADDEWHAAQAAGADVLVTGEVKQHNALAASEAGFALLAAGHYETEQPGMEALAQKLGMALPEVEVNLFAPPPGTSGRRLSE